MCIEYCASIGKDLSVTVAYKDDFDRHKEHESGFYCNASLKGAINVMRKKGYTFVGTVYGLNAFHIVLRKPGQNNDPPEQDQQLTTTSRYATILPSAKTKI